MALALLADIRVGWKRLPKTNGSAYLASSLLTEEKV
jgi:hypothetical protein